MSTKKYKVNLSEEEKLHLQAVLRKGKSAARKQTRAHILGSSAESVGDIRFR